MNFDWNQVRAFLATVEEGSLSAAARALGSTQPTLGRQVTALEEKLGVVLFERVGRSLALTPSGLGLLDHVRAMGEAASRISLAASGQSQIIEGQVRITASDVYSAFVLPRVISRLRDVAPMIEIDVVADNDIKDLQHREADIAVRHVRPEEPELIAQLVNEESARFYAASAYITRRGRPKTIDDLAKHDFVGFGDTDRMLEHLVPLGLNLTRQNFKLSSENGVVAWQFVREGLGVSIMADAVAQDCPDIELLLPEFPPVKFPVWLTTHRELHTSRRIRLVFDVLAETLNH